MIKGNRLIFIVVTICSFFVGCTDQSSKQTSRKTVTYIAFNNKDTAKAELYISAEIFKGILEIDNGTSKDSGTVNGIVKGDTLIGDYNFQRYGLKQWKRKPIVFLKRGNTLIMGEGKTINTWGRIHFDPAVPIRYPDSNFVFTKSAH